MLQNQFLRHNLFEGNFPEDYSRHKDRLLHNHHPHKGLNKMHKESLKTYSME